ncbi:right-handed parallel beta-helix repeat-containing protein [Paenibacillus albus]|nr:right-handed parallel beta-helix repeat-containing protein [Paenibacillus albus]
MLQTVKPYAGMIITEDVVFEPGEYVFKSSKGIVIAADHITIDGNGAVIRGRGKPGNIHTFNGTGVSCNGYNGVTVKNLSVHGFKIGMKVANGSGWIIAHNDFSDNYTDPDYGWGDGEPNGALLLERVSESIISHNIGNRVWNGLYLRYANRNKVIGNTFAHCTNVCLKLWGASGNEIDGNIMNYGIRIAPGEVHARDSTSVLIETGSNDNRILNNDFTYGGDGVFIRSLNGYVSTGNYFENNDASYANNNAWEVWDPGNVFVRNKGNYSSYGFWLGGSCHAVLIENEAAYNGVRIANAPEEFGNAGIAIVNGSSSHFTMRHNRIHHNKSVGLAIGYKEGYEAGHWIIEQNEITENSTYGVYIKHAKGLYFAGNRLSGNGSGDFHHEVNVSQVEVCDAVGPSPVAVATLATASPRAGVAVEFDATYSQDIDGGSSLTYLWDLGDGTRSKAAAARHIYAQAGFYRVGLTVISCSGTADLDWIDLYVLPDEELIKHRVDMASAVMKETIPSRSAQLELNEQEAVDAGPSLKLQAASSMVKLQLDMPCAVVDEAFAYGCELRFWIKFSHETWGGFPPSALTVRMKQTDTRYVQWVAACPLFEWTQIASEARSGWSQQCIPLTGEESGWVRSMTGNLDLNQLQRLEFQITSIGGDFTIWFDEIAFVQE